MRIVSLVPAATEIACALGASRELVAVTHDDDFPPEVRTLPRVTRSTIPGGSSSGAIDALVRAAGERGESTFHLDAEVLREARPEVILGQTLCAVCAVTLEQLPPALADLSRAHGLARHRKPRSAARSSLAPKVVPLDAGSLEGIFADIRRVARALGRAERAQELIASLRGRLAAVERAVAGRPRPRVACLEWVDPLMNGGHWVPEQVALAGGLDVLGATGARSRVIGWEELVASAPEVLVLMLCGFDARRALADAPLLTERPAWRELPAVRTGRVFAVDGAAYFSRPGPRVVDGVEVLAAILHPAVMAPPGGAEMLRVVSDGSGAAGRRP